VVTVLRWCLMNAAVTGQLKSIQNHLMSDYPTHQELTYTNKGTLHSARVYLSSEELYQSWHNLKPSGPYQLGLLRSLPSRQRNANAYLSARLRLRCYRNRVLQQSNPLLHADEPQSLSGSCQCGIKAYP
jgi:hypothetical protein